MIILQIHLDQRKVFIEPKGNTTRCIDQNVSSPSPEGEGGRVAITAP
jgi:hypothetical protein